MEGAVVTHRKRKVDESIMVNGEQSQNDKIVDSGVLLSDLKSEKFQLLLPLVYPLNKSRYKSVIIGLQINVETRTIEPVIGIFNDKASGVIFTAADWKVFTEAFKSIDDFFVSDDNGKSKKYTDKPVEHDRFSITYTHLFFNLVKSKVICLKQVETVSDHVEEFEVVKNANYVPSIVLKKNSFEVLRDLEPIITNYVSELNDLIPCVDLCMTAVIECSRKELSWMIETDIPSLNKSVMRSISCDVLRSQKIQKFVKVKVGHLNCAKASSIYNKIIREMYVFYADLLIYYIFN